MPSPLEQFYEEIQHFDGYEDSIFDHIAMEMLSNIVSPDTITNTTADKFYVEQHLPLTHILKDLEKLKSMPDRVQLSEDEFKFIEDMRRSPLDADFVPEIAQKIREFFEHMGGISHEKINCDVVAKAVNATLNEYDPQYVGEDKGKSMVEKVMEGEKGKGMGID